MSLRQWHQKTTEYEGHTLHDDAPTACELFTAANAAFRERGIARAAAYLRQGFFGNLYIAPLLQNEEFSPQEIWYPSSEAHPQAAHEYVRRYGKLWRQDPAALEFLGEVWNDPLVCAELRSYINLCKNILNAETAQQYDDLLDDWAQFVNPERVKRTQAEILDRIARIDLLPAAGRPRLGLVLLASKDPASSLAFYRQLMGVEPLDANQIAGGYVEFEFAGVRVAIHGHDQLGRGDPYRLGAPPESFGWGALFVFQVGNIEHYFRNARAAEIEIVDAQMAPVARPDQEDVTSKIRPGAPEVERRYFVVRDPSGYLIELTEDEPRGLESP